MIIRRRFLFVFFSLGEANLFDAYINLMFVFLRWWLFLQQALFSTLVILFASKIEQNHQGPLFVVLFFLSSLQCHLAIVIGILSHL